MTPLKPKQPIVREDHPGHLDPQYAASLRSKGGSVTHDDNRVFVEAGPSARDAFAQELGEEAVVAMTSGEDGLVEDLDKQREEELGGPFVESTASKEFAKGTDESNPSDAKREPFPTT